MAGREECPREAGAAMILKQIEGSDSVVALFFERAKKHEESVSPSVAKGASRLTWEQQQGRCDAIQGGPGWPRDGCDRKRGGGGM